MPTIIPMKPGIPDYSMTVDIEDVTYEVDARWNEQVGGWYVSITDLDGAVVFQWARVVLGTYIGRRSSHPLTRAGVFVARDTSGAGVDAGLDDLGARVQLVYYTNADVVVLGQLFGDAATARQFRELIPVPT